MSTVVKLLLQCSIVIWHQIPAHHHKYQLEEESSKQEYYARSRLKGKNRILSRKFEAPSPPPKKNIVCPPLSTAKANIE